jgi:hypothetical protein
MVINHLTSNPRALGKEREKERKRERKKEREKEREKERKRERKKERKKVNHTYITVPRKHDSLFNIRKLI